MKLLLLIPLSILSIRAFSRMYGHITRLRRPRFLIKRVIEFFRKSYGITMDDYVGESSDYKSLSEFFIRPLDPSKRVLTPVENAIVSPADGQLTEVQTIYQDTATQVKGKTYSVSEMIGKKLDFSEGWHVAVIYLSPSNYHRYHYPLTGTVSGYYHTGARLFPVNQIGLNYVDRLFVRNERIVVEMRHKDTPCYVIAVGATFVGSIKMEFIKEKRKRHQHHPVNETVTQLQEMGRFEMGSTIVMVIPKKIAEPVRRPGHRVDSLTVQQVRLGEPLFSLKS